MEVVAALILFYIFMNMVFLAMIYLTTSGDRHDH